MAKKFKYPHRIDTDQGEAIVKLIPDRTAIKRHKCPECNNDTGLCEAHVLILPVSFTGNRRYLHKNCYESAVKSGKKLTMHPKADYLTPNI